jgi:hypothetical protein
MDGSMVYLTTEYQLSIKWYEWMAVFSKPEKAEEEAVVVYFKALSRHEGQSKTMRNLRLVRDLALHEYKPFQPTFSGHG